jgi:hypothetical protein
MKIEAVFIVLIHERRTVSAGKIGSNDLKTRLARSI